MGTSAKILADSIAPCGKRLITFEATFHRTHLAEVNTHRMFSRSSASSRAIPIEKRIKEALENPAYPARWGKNQKGMQAEFEVEDAEKAGAIEDWCWARDQAVEGARRLMKRGIHKEVANRLLEPYIWHTAVISYTEDAHFYSQRAHGDAAKEFYNLAIAMREAAAASIPRQLKAGQWHLPYVDVPFSDERWELVSWWGRSQYNPRNDPNLTDEQQEARDKITDGLSEEEFSRRAMLPLAAISAARCARVSFLTHDGHKSFDADYELYLKLCGGDPKHNAPLEHPAMAESTLRRSGNFIGWRQLREDIDPLFIKWKE